MTTTPGLTCRDDRERRRLARGAPLNGLDYLEVGDDQRHLRVYFLQKAPDWITARNLRIDGGQRVRGIRVLEVKFDRSQDPEQDDCMTVTVDQPGDFSTYTLCVVALDESGVPTGLSPADFDPRYTCLCFSFKVGCPSDLDCNAPRVCPEPIRAEPAIDYLAKDYASFRRLILDRLALVMPDWQERHVPDVGVTLVETLAYAGDHLSYYQDAVATEAYLDTARQRISVRRHARLVDYSLHEGCNARTWVTLAVSQTSLRLGRGEFYFVTSSEEMTGPILKTTELPTAQPAPYLVFEPMWPEGATESEFYADHNEIRFYAWSEKQCCLPKGTMSATLLDPGTIQQGTPMPEPGDCGDDTPSQKPPGDSARRPRPGDYRLRLKKCDVLILEEVKGARTGVPADADPARRHAVRLTAARQSWDPVTGQLVVEVEWAPEDALPFPLCISSVGPPPDCSLIQDVSVARGNALLVDHGRSVNDDLGSVPTAKSSSECEDDCHPAEARKTPGKFRPTLPRPDLTFSEPASPCVVRTGCGERTRVVAASTMLRQDPHKALPWIRLRSIPAAPNGEPAFLASDLDDPSALARALAIASEEEPKPTAWLRGQLTTQVQTALSEWAAKQPPQQLEDSLKARLLELLRSLDQEWEARRDLLESGPDDRHFVVEIDDGRKAHLRFGDGDCGRVPDAGETFRAAYRIGNGAVGNVGADTITYIVFTPQFSYSGLDLRPRNPLRAVGGRAPEIVPEARLRAPHVFRSRLERAVTADDYAEIVKRDFASRVQRAAATMCWNGIGPEVLIAVDALGQAEPDQALLCEIEHHLRRFRRMGHDLQVAAAQSVPLDIGLFVCVRDGYLRGHVKAALLEAFGNRPLTGGRLGFFHPDNMTFGQGIYLSQVVAIAQGVEGVGSVRVTRFERLYAGLNGEIDAGVLTLGPLEVARLDNDPGFPEHGRLTLKLEGGR